MKMIVMAGFVLCSEDCWIRIALLDSEIALPNLTTLKESRFLMLAVRVTIFDHLDSVEMVLVGAVVVDGGLVTLVV